MDAITTPPAPVNEQNLDYAPGSPERAALEAELTRLAGTQVDLTATIGGSKVMGGGAEIPVVQPHAHASVLGVLKNSTRNDAEAAVRAATEAAPGWRALLLRRPRGDHPAAPPTCWPARGVPGSTRPPCSASPRRRGRPRSTPRAS